MKLHPLTREERHALAARVRLGEVIPGETAAPLWVSVHYDNWGTQDGGCYYTVLGTVVAQRTIGQKGLHCGDGRRLLESIGPGDEYNIGGPLLRWLEAD